MRQVIKDFIKICSETLPIKEPIYEFGALQVSGQIEFGNPFWRWFIYGPGWFYFGMFVLMITMIGYGLIGILIKHFKNKKIGVRGKA